MIRYCYSDPGGWYFPSDEKMEHLIEKMKACSLPQSGARKVEWTDCEPCPFYGDTCKGKVFKMDCPVVMQREALMEKVNKEAR